MYSLRSTWKRANKLRCYSCVEALLSVRVGAFCFQGCFLVQVGAGYRGSRAIEIGSEQGMAEMLRFSRRAFCAGAGALVARGWALPRGEGRGYALVAKTDRGRIVSAANKYVLEKPRPLTDFPSPKSPGGPHDFFSQADYFWPDPAHPDGPYINRTGRAIRITSTGIGRR